MNIHNTPQLQIAVTKMMEPAVAVQTNTHHTRTRLSLACPGDLHRLLTLNCYNNLTSLCSPLHVKYLLQFALLWEHIPTSVSQCLSVLRTARLSLLISLLQYLRRPVWSLPPSHLPAELTAARRRRGNPRSGLDSAMAFTASLFSPGPGSLQRDVVSGASSRSDGTVTYTAVSGRAERRAECAPQPTHFCSGAGWWDVLPDVKPQTSWLLYSGAAQDSHVIIRQTANDDREYDIIL